MGRKDPASPGALAGRYWPLDTETVKRFEQLAADGEEEEVRKALEGLLPRLDDELITQRRTSIHEGGNARLTHFHGRDGFAAKSFFAVVTAGGEVLLGRVDTLEVSSRQRLGDFKPLRDETLSVTVTDRLRPVGDCLDFFIVTRSLPDGEAREQIRAYHGLIYVDHQGRPFLELPSDDRSGQRARRWSGEDASRLPLPLRHVRFASAVGIDPFALPTEIPWYYSDLGDTGPAARKVSMVLRHSI